MKILPPSFRAGSSSAPPQFGFKPSDTPHSPFLESTLSLGSPHTCSSCLKRLWKLICAPFEWLKKIFTPVNAMDGLSNRSYISSNPLRMGSSPIPNINSHVKRSMVSAAVPIRNVNDDAVHLAQTFLSLKNSIRANSGYHVQLTRNASAWKLSIQATGRDDMPIVPPDQTLLRECTCCQTCFEHTFKSTSSHPLLAAISAIIAPYDLFAVFSRTGNLLLVPDTRKSHIGVRDFPHLFSLNASQLQKVFAATLATDAFLRSRDSSYSTRTVWHNGKEGTQTVPVLHVRQEGLRPIF